MTDTPKEKDALYGRKWRAGLASGLILLIAGGFVTVIEKLISYNVTGPGPIPTVLSPSSPHSQEYGIVNGEVPEQKIEQVKAVATGPNKLLIVPPCERVLRSRSSYTRGVSGEQTGLEVCQSLLEDAIIGMGGRVVERQRLDSVLEEISFQQHSGLVDEKSIAQAGRILGAGYVVIGSLLNEEAEKSSFSGYGIKTNTIKYVVTLRVRVLEVQSSLVKFSQSFTGSTSETASKYGGTETSEGMKRALQDAVSKLEEDQALRRILK